MSGLRIAILAHSTNPRGGVVHALALGEALADLGHEAVVHAPDAKGTGFFRKSRCSTVLVPASAFYGGTYEMVQTRVADYLRHFQTLQNRRFDVFHAHDGISGNAMATLRQGGLIDSFARTVHHIDSFDDDRVTNLQARSIVSASRHFTVSRLWQDRMFSSLGLRSTIVGNGVDTSIYSPVSDPADATLRQKLGLGEGPVFLSVGGIEARKNSIRILQAFIQARAVLPTAQLVIAGGASVLDHASYRAEFDSTLRHLYLNPNAFIVTGPLPQADLAALYRLSDALVFASIKEGFGLVVLEAMASGLPVVTSRIAPFTEYLGDGDVVWCDPNSCGSIADAMVLVLNPSTRSRLAARGHTIAARHDWSRTAAAHLSTYRAMGASQHA